MLVRWSAYKAVAPHRAYGSAGERLMIVRAISVHSVYTNTLIIRQVSFRRTVWYMYIIKRADYNMHAAYYIEWHLTAVHDGVHAALIKLHHQVSLVLSRQYISTLMRRHYYLLKLYYHVKCHKRSHLYVRRSDFQQADGAKRALTCIGSHGRKSEPPLSVYCVI